MLSSNIMRLSISWSLGVFNRYLDGHCTGVGFSERGRVGGRGGGRGELLARRKIHMLMRTYNSKMHGTCLTQRNSLLTARNTTVCSKGRMMARERNMSICCVSTNAERNPLRCLLPPSNPSSSAYYALAWSFPVSDMVTTNLATPQYIKLRTHPSALQGDCGIGD